MTMRTKDEHIGLRLPTNLKKELQELGKREGRTLSQICEMFLSGGLENYKKEGSRYLQRLLSQQKKKHITD
jgi:predicted DNA-binding protein